LAFGHLDELHQAEGAHGTRLMHAGIAHTHAASPTHTFVRPRSN
jgi:hypothetical protein